MIFSRSFLASFSSFLETISRISLLFWVCSSMHFMTSLLLLSVMSPTKKCCIVDSSFSKPIYSFLFCSINIIKMQPVGFEPTSVATIDLESTALDRSATTAINIVLRIHLNEARITLELLVKYF